MKNNIQRQLMTFSKRMFHGFLIQMIGCSLLLANTGNAQRKTIDKVRIAVSGDTQSLITFFKTVEAATPFRFTYNSDFVDLSQQVALTKKRPTIYDALGEISRQTDLKFVQVNENIHVKMESNREAAAVSIEDQPVLDVSGRVVDSEGEPLPGVTITVLGTNVGTVTDLNGNYSLSVKEGAALVFSFIGFESQTIQVSNQSILDVTLNEDVASLEEVIVVGYGTQKKANMTGAVATVGGDEIIKRPLNNVAGLLQGKVAGLQVSSHSGKPGSENNSLRIRGLGTFSAAGSEPLVLINGIAGDMTNLDPNDVESVSVLKDAASSAIYGARAANGVILITTKRGQEGSLSIDIHSNVQVHQPTRLPELLSNSADYMMYWNQGRARAGGQAPYFSQEEIDAYRNNPNNPINYPNFDWIDHSFRTAVANMQSIRVSGGNEKTSVGLSLGYFDQPGLTSLYEFKKYNARLTVDSKINDWISVGGDIQLVNKDIQRSNWDNGNVDYQILAIYGAGPNYTPTMTLPDGSTGYVARYSSNIGEWTVRNPDAQDASGIQTDINYNVLPQFYVEIKPMEHLTWYTKGAVSYDNRALKNHETPVDNYFFEDGSYAHNNSTWQLGVRETWNTGLWTTFYSTLNYRRLFNETHNINILAGYNQEYSSNRQLRGSRVHFPTNVLKELDAGAPLDQTTGGYLQEWAIMSFFGRAMYDYNEKYLVEANIRYDGTSRISPDNRWGVFPSMSAGWRISQEPFLQQNAWIDNLKIRGSWGQLGNQNVGLYPFQEVLTTTSYPFNTAHPGAFVNRLVDPNLRWETTTMTDIGIDLSMKEGLINVTFDWFDKVTDDILYNVPIPASVGLSPPTVNYGKMRNTGIELELSSMKQFGDFGYNISANFSTFRNEVLRILSPVYGSRYTIQEGLPFNSHFMVEWDGIFQNEEEIANSPQHQFNPKPGDLKFVDQNDDGVINADDRVVMDGAYPRFHYGSTINLSWKNFDLNAFFQGLEGYKQSTQGLSWGLVPYIQGSPPPVDFIENMWTGEGSTNAHPAMYISGYAPVTGTRNSYWLMDASYFRLKNLAIGYNLPSRISEQIGLKFARLYMSGDNLFTITDWPGSDPERANTHWFQAYPQITSYTLGLKVTL